MLKSTVASPLSVAVRLQIKVKDKGFKRSAAVCGDLCLPQGEQLGGTRLADCWREHGDGIDLPKRYPTILLDIISVWQPLGLVSIVVWRKE